jgi:hypothetical protein
MFMRLTRGVARLIDITADDGRLEKAIQKN